MRSVSHVGNILVPPAARFKCKKKQRIRQWRNKKAEEEALFAALALMIYDADGFEG